MNEQAAERAASVTVGDLADAYKALSDRKRLRLLRVLHLARTSLCVPELVDILMEPQYAVSRAIGALRRAGLVREERRGTVAYVEPAARAEALGVATAVSALEHSDRLTLDADRLRWRLSIRSGETCTVTYTRGYNPEEYGSGAAVAARTGASVRKARILFVCVHNTARSQLAEEYLRREAGDLFDVESAGLVPGTLNPYVVRILAEDGIDIAAKETRSVFDVYLQGHTYAYVITVCSREAEEKCPIFPGPVRRLNWPFPDPSSFTGTEEQLLEQTRAVARQVRAAITAFVAEYRATHQGVPT